VAAKLWKLYKSPKFPQFPSTAIFSIGSGFFKKSLDIFRENGPKPIEV
jgi:hypothetical protein